MKNRGFTLVELLAAIAVLGLVLLIAVPNVAAIIRNSTEDAFKSDAISVVKQIKLKSLEYSDFDLATINEGNISSVLSIPSENYKEVAIYKRTNDVAIRIVGGNEWEGLIACGTYDEMVVNEGLVCGNDSVSPTITVLGANPATVIVGNTYTDAGATANDNLDGDITSYIETVNNVNANVVGQYKVTYRVLDSSGVLGMAERDVYVVNDGAPVVMVTGDNPVTLNAGSTYTDAGATATDDVDGNITNKIVTTSNVNPNVLGTYTVTYTATDTANNIGVAYRTVNVVDSAGATITFSMNGNSTYAKSRTTTVTVSDNVGVDTSSLKYLWTTSSTVPSEENINTSFTNGASISTPAGVTGTYYLWILAKDTSSNKTIVGSNAFYLDNTVPIITVLGSNPNNISVGSTYTDAGATASDSSDGNITSDIATTSNVNPNIAGAYTVTYSVTDTAGNIATTTRTVNIQTLYRYRDWYASGHYVDTCDTCYETCANATNFVYSCPEGSTLSGTQCISTEEQGVTSWIDNTYYCTASYGWAWNSNTCYGNCNQLCPDGSSANGYITEDNCTSYYGNPSCSPVGSQTVCSTHWRGSCYVTTTTDATASCPSGYTSNGTNCVQSYSCNPYNCNCSTTWTDTSSWGSWSAWSTTPATASDTRQVQTCSSAPCAS